MKSTIPILVHLNFTNLPFEVEPQAFGSAKCLALCLHHESPESTGVSVSTID
jgi:hypothetical protein